MSELSKILNEANINNWSLRDIEKQANKHGHKLNYSTAGKYLSGRHGEPTAEVLQAFADIFRLDVNDLRAASSLPSIGEPFILPAEAAQLTPAEREAIRNIIRVMIEEKRKAAIGMYIQGHNAGQEAEKKERPAPITMQQSMDRMSKYGDMKPLPKEFFDLAAHPISDLPGMREHAEGLERGEESQEQPDEE